MTLYLFDKKPENRISTQYTGVNPYIAISTKE